MMKLLRGHDVPKAFKAARRNSSSKAKIAVAFWGKGAVAKLGLNGGLKADVLCNARHEGCNPEVILHLVNKGHSVKTNDRLHAKIYLVDKMVIIGSSNVSTNGLDQEGSAANVWIEANIITDDVDTVKAAGDLFRTIWLRSKPIKVPELKRLIKARKMRPSHRQFISTPFLLEACREHPDVFEDVGILMWSRLLEKDARDRFSAWKKKIKPARRSGLTTEDIQKADSFGFEADIPAGWYLVWKVPEKGEPKYGGLFRIDYKIGPYGEDGNQYVGIKRREIRLSNGQAVKLSRADKDFLMKHIDRLDKKFDDGVVTLPRAIKYLDRVV